mgnify:CR=1 FL=1
MLSKGNFIFYYCKDEFKLKVYQIFVITGDVLVMKKAGAVMMCNSVPVISF